MKPLPPAVDFFLHLAILAVLGPLALLNHRHGMFNGLDGDYIRILIAEQHDWMPFGLSLTLNPFQGIGNVFLGTNFNLVPALLLQWPWAAGQVEPLTTYTLFALELFAAGYLAARVIDLPRAAGIIGAWTLTVLALPLLPEPRLYAVFGLIPHAADLLLGLMLILWAVRQVSEGAGVYRWAAGIVLTFLPAFLVAQNPILVMIIAPAGLAWTLAIVGTGKSSHHLKWRICGLLSSLIVLAGGGFAIFLVGSTFYTVPAFFSAELHQAQDILQNASIAFQGNPTWKQGVGVWLVGLSAAGALVSLIAGRGRERWFAVVHLGLMLAVLGGGWYIVTYAHGWRGPQMIYFEIAVWPFYTAYAGYFAVALLRSAARLVNRTAIPDLQLPAQFASAFVAAAVLSWGATAGAPGPTRIFPPARTPVVAALQKEIGLRPEMPFRGFAATFTGAGAAGQAVSWFDLVVFDSKLEQATGNDHRFVGLWYYGIPTLQEYNQYATPPSYLLESRLLARPYDRQIRNTTLLTELRPAILETLGVRFVVSDRPLSSPARLVLSQASGTGVTVHLYELPRPNLGDFSPDRAVRAANATEALAAIEREDLRQAVVTAEALPGNLVPAQDARLTFSREGARIAARSDGRAILVLPLQFSRCLIASGPSAGKVSLFRANLVQTGILFEGRLDLTLALRIGPLRGAGCRLEDMRDMREYGLERAARERPIGLAAEHAAGR